MIKIPILIANHLFVVVSLAKVKGQVRIGIKQIPYGFIQISVWWDFFVSNDTNHCFFYTIIRFDIPQ